jgi:hypothetical protein
MERKSPGSKKRVQGNLAIVVGACYFQLIVPSLKNVENDEII